MLSFKDLSHLHLKRIASFFNRHIGIKGYSRMKKDELINELEKRLLINENGDIKIKDISNIIIPQNPQPPNKKPLEKLKKDKKTDLKIKSTNILMDTKKDIKLFKTYKNKFNKLISEKGEVPEKLTDNFFRTFPRENIYRILMEKYLKKKEVSDIVFVGYGFEKMGKKKIKMGNVDVKDNGDIEDGYNFNDDYVEEEDSFRYPKFWRFRTDKSKIYNEFISDIDFLKNIGILKTYKVEKGNSSKKAVELKGVVKYESSGTYTKDSTDINLRDNMVDDYE